MTPTDLHSFLRSRRSVRRFKQQAVPDAVLSEILQTAMFAPSAHNRQPWRFCVLQSEDAKSTLADAMLIAFQRELEADQIPEQEIQRRLKRSRAKITNAPLIVVLSVDMSEMDQYQDARRKKAEYIIATQSVANAGLQLLLAAHAEGLGAVWICSPMFAQKAVQSALRFPPAWEPQAMFIIGYPDEAPAPRERKPISDVLMQFDFHTTIKR